MGFSGFRLVKEALTGHRGWTPLWRNPEPIPACDVVIVGGGGHGLATACSRARAFGLRTATVLKRVGSGRVTRGATRRSSARTACCRATSRFASFP